MIAEDYAERVYEAWQCGGDLRRLMIEAIRAAMEQERRWFTDWDFTVMPCGHQRRMWSPHQGNPHSVLAIVLDPAAFAFCEICRAAASEREACARVARELAGYDSHDWAMAAETIEKAIRARSALPDAPSPP